MPFGRNPARSGFARFRSRRMPALLLLGALWAPPAAAAEGERLHLSYRIYTGGIGVMAASAVLELAAGRYAIEVDARTEGLIGGLFSWRSTSRTEGRIVGPAEAPAAEPDGHRSTGAWRGDPRRIAIDYEGRKPVVVERVPTPEQEPREPVAPALVHDTVDQLSAVAGVLLRLVAGRGCTSTVAVFDGRRRYDLVFRDAGARQLAASGYSAYGGGAAIACEVTSRMIAGRRLDEDRDDRKPRPPARVMFAPIADGWPPIPVRLEVEGSIGTLIAHLDGFERRPLQAAEAPPGR